MPNPFFQPGEERASKVSELFARIAPRYDLLNDLQSLGLHRLWKRTVVRLASPRTGERALDVCCGTGDIARALARHGAEVIGVDFSAEMLTQAQRRPACQVSHPPSYLHADALKLPFEADHFDIVTTAYGLRNLSNWEAGLAEMHRVARPGARLVILEFGKPRRQLWRRVYFGYLKFFVPILGQLFCGSAAAYAYILESLKNYPGQEGVAAWMRAAKLKEVRVMNMLGGAMSINFGRKAQRPE
jgi:demethylmenaquinone methyltransferase/2-methoxy-6-polyprenyl-1,4-benzoquinol methylase